MIAQIPTSDSETNKPAARVSLPQQLATIWRAKFFSPKDFVRRALILTFLFAIAHLCGLKEFTSVLNGTTGSVALGWTTSALLGLAYVLLYLGFVLLAPIFLLTAAILFTWARLFGGKSSSCP
jgi:hypothetical protein